MKNAIWQAVLVLTMSSMVLIFQLFNSNPIDIPNMFAFIALTINVGGIIGLISWLR